MTTQRAKEILHLAKTTPHDGPWVDNIKMTEEEKAFVNKVWDSMPGHTNFINALQRIANT